MFLHSILTATIQHM